MQKPYTLHTFQRQSLKANSMHYIILTLCLALSFSACKKASNQSDYTDTGEFWDCYHEQNLDSTGTANAAVGRWVVSAVTEGSSERLQEFANYVAEFSNNGRLTIQRDGSVTSHEWQLAPCDGAAWEFQIAPIADPFSNGCIMVCGDEMLIQFSHRDGEDYILERTP